MKQITDAIDLAPAAEEGLLLARPVEPGSTTYYVYVAEGEGGSCGAPWNALPEFEDEEAAEETCDVSYGGDIVAMCLDAAEAALQRIVPGATVSDGPGPGQIVMASDDHSIWVVDDDEDLAQKEPRFQTPIAFPFS